LDWDAAGGRRAAFLAPAWGVGVVRGAGRRGSVACAVAQRALLCAFMFVLMFFLYFRSYFRCILAVLYLCAAVYGVIKNNNNIGAYRTKSNKWRNAKDISMKA